MLDAGEKENTKYNVLTEQKLERTGIQTHSSHSKYLHWLAVKSGVLTSLAQSNQTFRTTPM